MPALPWLSGGVALPDVGKVALLVLREGGLLGTGVPWAEEELDDAPLFAPTLPARGAAAVAPDAATALADGASLRMMARASAMRASVAVSQASVARCGRDGG